MWRWVVLAGLVAGCGGARRSTSEVEGSRQGAAVSREDLERLRWLEGRWGVGADADFPLYVDHVVDSDTSFTVRLYSSNQFADAVDSLRAVLQEGRLEARTDDDQWVATAVDSEHLTLVASQGGAPAAFTLSRVSTDRIRVRLTWRYESGEVRHRTVQADRIRR